MDTLLTSAQGITLLKTKIAKHTEEGVIQIRTEIGDIHNKIPGRMREAEQEDHLEVVAMDKVIMVQKGMVLEGSLVQIIMVGEIHGTIASQMPIIILLLRDHQQTHSKLV